MRKDLWLKGSLHCHSKISDGLFTPKEVAHYYEIRGYRLLSLTDHDKISRVENFKGVYLPGIEVSKGKCKLGESYHIVVLGIEDPSITSMNDPQTLIDYVNNEDGLAFIAHPYWSNLTHEDLACIEDYIGIEVYNTGCDVEVAKGYSVTYWDNILSSNERVWGLAVDDAHRYFKHPIDADGGWIWVKVHNANPVEVLRSLKNGEFYSSMAPKILSFKYSQNILEVESTPIYRLDIVAPNGKGLSISLKTIFKILEDWKDPYAKKTCEGSIANLECTVKGVKREIHLETVRGDNLIIEDNGKGLIRVEIKKEFKYQYVRVELTDNEGRRAWVNPVFNP